MYGGCRALNCFHSLNNGPAFCSAMTCLYTVKDGLFSTHSFLCEGILSTNISYICRCRLNEKRKRFVNSEWRALCLLIPCTARREAEKHARMCCLRYTFASWLFLIFAQVLLTFTVILEEILGRLIKHN